MLNKKCFYYFVVWKSSSLTKVNTKLIPRGLTGTDDTDNSISNIVFIIEVQLHDSRQE
jgi:hypothetical protein